MCNERKDNLLLHKDAEAREMPKQNNIMILAVGKVNCSNLIGSEAEEGISESYCSES